LALLIAIPSLAWAWSGEVVGVADGDTITVLRDKEQVRIRLYGIDCPERSQAYSKKAKKLTSKLVYGKVVEVKAMDTDRYGRTVAMVYVELNACPLTGVSIKTLLNEELVKAGLAWVYYQYCHELICHAWTDYQFAAKLDKRGLWRDSDPIPPWEFRRKQRKK
jgi:endonuclease YncB( thermonuclease family)